MDQQSPHHNNKTTRRDRLLRPVRIGAAWGAAVFVFLGLPYSRHGLKDPLGGDFYLSNAEVFRVVVFLAAVAFVAGWILSAPIFLFIRSSRAARVTEVVIATIGTTIVLSFAVLGT
jgi:hypothetical protein